MIRRLTGLAAVLAAFPTAQAADRVAPYSDPSATRALMRHSERELTHRGKIVEVQPTGNYIYLRVEQPDGHVWLAAPKQEVVPGDELRWGEGVEMHDYKSQQLDRFFHKVVFVDWIEIVR